MSLLEVRGLEVFFDLPDGELHAVQGVGFSLSPGERLGIVGESGSGKTTTILALMGLLPPTASVAGDVRLDGRDLLGGGERGCDSWRWREIATVFQGAMNAFNPVRTIGWQIAEPMEVHRTAVDAAARSRTRELLALTGLPPGIERAYPHELSGGMRQRAAIAMALACEPKVLLADEPTTALDVVVQDGILRLLTRLTDELGLAMILVTHDLAAAAAACTRLAVMYAGRIVEEAPANDLAAAPEHPYTRQLFAAIPDLLGDTAVRSIRGVPPRLDRPVVGCPFAPRCEVRFDRCDHERPALIAVAHGWNSACHRSVAGSQATVGPAAAVPAPRSGDVVARADPCADSTGQAGRRGNTAAPPGTLASVAGPPAAAGPTGAAGPPAGVGSAAASLTAEPRTAAAVLPASRLADDGRPASADRAPGAAFVLDQIFVSFPRRRSAADLMRGKPRPLVRAVDGISLEVAPGELVALVGESGSGKSSTANAIVGNAELSGGDIVIAGQRMSEMGRTGRRHSHRQVQLVYQDPYESLDPRKRVRAILDEPLRVNRIGRGRAERRQIAARALAQVGLDPPDLYAERYPHELSGGQRQRVAIAAALVIEPMIIIADEPVSMLDVSIRAEVLAVFDNLRRTLSVAIVMITHDLSTAAHYADRIAVMYLGRIVELGPADQVVRSPRHPYTRALIAAVPSVGQGYEQHGLLPGEIPDAMAMPSGCRFHPRCPVALPSCSRHDPDFVTVGPGHVAACVVAS
jgi:peptide/nickel transport system ATP-binding protein